MMSVQEMWFETRSVGRPVAGRPTTAGCPGFASVADTSAPVVELLERAGAILVGKTNVPEFGTIGHTDINGKVVARRDFTGSPGGADDFCNHGTHVAGIAAARADDGLGVPGVAYQDEVKLLAIRVCGTALGLCNAAGIANGIIWAVDNGLAFHREMKLRTVIWDFAGLPVPPSLRHDLERLVGDGLPDQLHELLDEEERTALLERARVVSQLELFPHDPTGRCQSTLLQGVDHPAPHC
jgi:hypothetical protein